MSSTEMGGRRESVTEIAQRLGIDPSEVVGTSAEGTVEATTHQGPPPPAEAQTTDNGGSGREPGPIPYSRFQEVNSRLNELKPYEILEKYGIEPDSAVRLANFEQAYVQDPKGTVALLVDNLDLPAHQADAIKSLLAAEAAAQTAPNEGDDKTVQLPPEVKEVVSWVRDRQKADTEAESQQRLDFVVNHWKSLDDKDGIKGVPERQRLQYIQAAAGVAGNGQFKTLEELSEAARAAFLEDRDVLLGGAVTQRRGSGSPIAVSSAGVPSMTPVIPKSMAEARKLIEADIERGVFPDLRPGG